ncbi:armadillo-type protein [Syncephalis fuscata]|nr:armadillo-type protein [Syncephalis fuscata]
MEFNNLLNTEHATVDNDLAESAALMEEVVHFREKTEVYQLIDQLVAPNVTKDRLKDIQYQLDTKIHPYLEQPHLLDPYLDYLVQPAMERLGVLVRQFDDHAQQQREKIAECSVLPLAEVEMLQLETICAYLYTVTKIRGYKTIVRFMTHQVEDLEPVFQFLYAQKRKSGNPWKVYYIMLLWLSLLCTVPFDLKIVDSQMGDNNKSVLVDRYIEEFETYLDSSGKVLDAAAYLIAKLVTRQDTAKTHLLKYIDHCLDRLKPNESAFMVKCWCLYTLCFIYKMGSRSDLVHTVPRVLSSLNRLNEQPRITSNQLIRTLRMKLIARLGTCVLPNRMAVWRYTMGKRRLTDHLNATTETKNEESSTAPTIADDEDYAESIEEIIEHLVQGLKVKDTGVRWLAAKGIGRVTLRLPLEMADDVISYVLQIQLNLTAASDNTWHGATLAIAELTRRGLLLPERLPEAMPWIEQALLFDIKRGSHSIGSNVRDITVTLFDREVHVRRAASAAMQENVGRQGNFPRGIELITMADYFAVGVRSNAYCSVAPEIAKFEEYRPALIDHLLKYKVTHWDQAIRTITAQAIGKMTLLDPTYLQEHALDELVKLALSRDLDARHGAIMTMSEICTTLSQLPNIDGNSESIQRVIKMVDMLDPAYLTSFGSDIVSYAMTQLAIALSHGAWPMTDELQQHWKQLIMDTLFRIEEWVRQSASKALAAFDSDAVSNHNLMIRSSLVDAIGWLKPKTLQQYQTQILQVLYSTAMAQNNPLDVETRRNGMKTYAKYMSPEDFDSMLDGMLSGLKDYTTNSHGDVGSWVREASMSSLEHVVLWLKQHASSSPLSARLRSDTARIEQMISGVLRQAVERIDRIRLVAGQTIFSLLYKSDLEIPGRSKLTEAIPEEDVIEWILAETIFSRITPLLSLAVYRKELFVGLITSAGGMTGSVTEVAIKEMVEYLRSLPKADKDTTLPTEWTIDQFVELAETVVVENNANERTLLPLYEVLAAILDTGLGQELNESTRRSTTITSDKSTAMSCRSIQKMKPCIQIYCGLLSNHADDPIRTLVWRRLLDCLFHTVSHIRRDTAEQLYLCLSGLDTDRVEESVDNDDDNLQATDANTTLEDYLLMTEWYYPP